MSTLPSRFTHRWPHPWARHLLALLLACLPVGAAHAHAFVIASHPAANGTVAPGAVAIDLQFNSRIDRSRARLVLVVADDDRRELVIKDDTRPDHVTADTAPLTAGSYRLEWYALSPDGHVTRGFVPFAVGQP